MAFKLTTAELWRGPKFSGQYSSTSTDIFSVILISSVPAVKAPASSTHPRCVTRVSRTQLRLALTHWATVQRFIATGLEAAKAANHVADTSIIPSLLSGRNKHLRTRGPFFPFLNIYNISPSLFFPAYYNNYFFWVLLANDITSTHKIHIPQQLIPPK